MRKYKNQEGGQLVEVYCNQCKKKLIVEKGQILEGVFHGKVKWGYFSEKDGEVHSFDLCEKCYDQWISGFQIPAEKLIEHEFI